MDKKKSIINIQDLGLFDFSQHCVNGQPILRVIFRKFYMFRKEILYFLKVFSRYRLAVDTLNESPKSFKKSINKRFVHN
jgi:hypothetical protein